MTELFMSSVEKKSPPACSPSFCRRGPRFGEYGAESFPNISGSCACDTAARARRTGKSYGGL